MPKSVIGMTIGHKGFTLIEILIVLVIIGITFGFALVSFGGFGENRRILFAAEQLMNTLHLAQQQAILETSTLGLRIDKDSYQILQLQNNLKWNPVSNRGIFKVTYFPKNTQTSLKTAHHTPRGTPSIIITSSGNMTPFTLHFGNTQEANIALIVGEANGDLKFNVVHNK